MADVFYRGYVETKNKKCIMKFKGKTSSQLLDLATAKTKNEFAGVLDDTAILVDIDDAQQSNTLLDMVKAQGVKCRVYETTRGKHFLFFNNGVNQCYTHTPLAIGLIADIKVGTKNSYQVLKFNGKERRVLYDTGTYDKIPDWLKPVQGAPAFDTLGDGDGRNKAMFSYILTMQRAGYAKAAIKETLTLVNKFVLKKPLSDDELNVILRDESFKQTVFFQKGENGENKFLFDKFARFLIAEHKICRLNGQLHIYRDGIYKLGQNDIERAMIEAIPNIRSNQRTEVMKYIELVAETVNQKDNTNYIAFENGVFDLAKWTLVPFSPDLYLTNKIPWNYNPTAKSQILEDTLLSLANDDPDIVALLEEAVGYCFFRRQELRKSFILTGAKGNGKSTFLDLLMYLLGPDNVSNLDLKDLNYRFSTASLGGVLANIGDDIGDEFVNGEAAATFKKIVTGNRVRAERKGKDEFFFNPYCKLFYSANDIPRIRDKTGAVIDRLIIIPFDATFDKNNPKFDPFLKYKLQDQNVMEALIVLALEGLKRVLTNQGFTVCDRVKNQLKEYEERNQPIIMYCREHEAADFVFKSTKDAYGKYQAFCLNNNFQPLGLGEFVKQIKKFYGFNTTEKRVNREKIKVFEPKKGENE